MCLRIGEQCLDIQINYEILWLGLSQTLLFLEISACFKEGYFLVVFMKNMASAF